MVIIANGGDHSIGLSDVYKLCDKSCKQPTVKEGHLIIVIIDHYAER